MRGRSTSFSKWQCTASRSYYRYQLQVGSGEVRPHAKKPLPRQTRHSVREAITEVQTRAVPALSVPGIRDHGFPAVKSSKGNLREPELFRELLQPARRMLTEPGLQHDARLRQGRRSDTHCAGRHEGLEDRLVSGLLQEHRENGRRVQDHTPTGP